MTLVLVWFDRVNHVFWVIFCEGKIWNIFQETKTLHPTSLWWLGYFSCFRRFLQIYWEWLYLVINSSLCIDASNQEETPTISQKYWLKWKHRYLIKFIWIHFSFTMLCILIYLKYHFTIWTGLILEDAHQAFPTLNVEYAKKLWRWKQKWYYFSDNKILFQTTLQKWIHFAHSKCSEHSDQRLKRKLKRRCHDCVLSQESESEESFASYSLISSQPFHLPLHQIGHVELPLVPGQSHVVALNVPRLDQRRRL